MTLPTNIVTRPMARDRRRYMEELLVLHPELAQAVGVDIPRGGPNPSPASVHQSIHLWLKDKYADFPGVNALPSVITSETEGYVQSLNTLHKWSNVQYGDWLDLNPGTRLGLHTTDVELAIWRDRAINGPYRVNNDLGNNNPGDWTRIVDRKNETLANWQVWTSAELVTDINGRVVAQSNTNFSSRAWDSGRRLRDSAFYALIKQDFTVANFTRDCLIEQTTQPLLDFSDRSRWGWRKTESEPENPFMSSTVLFITMFQTGWLHAYDYLLILENETSTNIFTQNQRDALNEYFYQAAHYWQGDINSWFDSVHDEGRWDWPNPTYKVGGGSSAMPPAWLNPDGSFTLHPAKARHYNNRRAHVLEFIGSVAVFLDQIGSHNVELLYWTTHMWCREALRFGFSPIGWGTDFERNADSSWSVGNRGFGTYGAQTPQSIATFADLLARTGDRSLWEFATREGESGSESPDQDKNLVWLLGMWGGYVTRDYERYGTNNPAHIGNFDKRLGSWIRRNSDNVLEYDELDLHYFATSNLKMRNNKLTHIVRRDNSEYPGITDGYKSVTTNDINRSFTSPQRSIPGVLFMFAHDGPPSGWPYPYPVPS